MGDKLLEQRINITFLVKLEKNVADIFRMSQQIPKKGTMSRTWVSV